MARQQFETKRPDKISAMELQFVRRPSPPPPANVKYWGHIPYVTTRAGSHHPMGVGCLHLADNWSGICAKRSCKRNEAALAQLQEPQEAPRESGHGPA